MEEQLDDLAPTDAPAPIKFEIGDSVVYPHHGAGKVLRKEVKEVLGESREYLTIKILHNDMTVMVPTENAALAGLRRVIDEETVGKVLAVLSDECSEMPKNWNRRFKHNRDKIKTGDIYELAEVVRNLAIREAQKGLSTGEKQMFTRAKKILASELMYALEMDEEQVDAHLYELLGESNGHGRANGNGKRSMSGKPSTNGKAGAHAQASGNGKVAVAAK
jgi:CarD family transcriptional regulator